MKNARKIQTTGKRKIIRSTKPTLAQSKDFAKKHKVPFHIAERALWEIENKNLLLSKEQAIKKAQLFWKKVEKLEKQIKEETKDVVK